MSSDCMEWALARNESSSVGQVDLFRKKLLRKGGTAGALSLHRRVT